MTPRLDDYDDEAWADAPPSHIGSAYPLSDKPKRKVKKPEFPIGFAIPVVPKPEPKPVRKRRRRKKDR